LGIQASIRILFCNTRNSLFSIMPAFLEDVNWSPEVVKSSLPHLLWEYWLEMCRPNNCSLSSYCLFGAVAVAVRVHMVNDQLFIERHQNIFRVEFPRSTQSVQCMTNWEISRTVGSQISIYLSRFTVHRLPS